MKLLASSVVQVEPVPASVVREQGLLDRARHGDPDAFGLLIEPRARRLLRTATVILGNEADAYEAAQEALIAAWRHLPRLRDPNRFDAWLNRTLVNKCRDAARKRGRIREVDLSEIDVRAPDAIDAATATRSLLAAFDRLAVDHRHILVLHYFDELSVNEIAAQLDIPAGTAKSRLWSARRSLERALEAEA